VTKSIPLPDGRLQAGLAMLIVADRYRKEDMTVLGRRIGEYRRG
jgi:hypothetical protein